MTPKLNILLLYKLKEYKDNSGKKKKKKSSLNFIVLVKNKHKGLKYMQIKCK